MRWRDAVSTGAAIVVGAVCGVFLGVSLAVLLAMLTL
jgi:hypothetical protein